MSEHIKHVSDATFEKDVLQSQTPVLVDYWAEWCGPCKMIAPVLDEVAKDYAGRLTVAKLDIDANPGTPAKFGIRGIPTLILFKGGKAARAEGRRAVEVAARRRLLTATSEPATLTYVLAALPGSPGRPRGKIHGAA